MELVDEWRRSQASERLARRLAERATRWVASTPGIGILESVDCDFFPTQSVQEEGL